MKIDGYELLPCPFCGKDAADFANAAELEDCKHFEDDTVCPAFEEAGSCNYIKVVCSVYKKGCGASAGYSYNKDIAAKKWNKRITAFIPIINIDKWAEDAKSENKSEKSADNQ